MRISDWSSDVCSSDLLIVAADPRGTDAQYLPDRISDVLAVAEVAQRHIGTQGHFARLRQRIRQVSGQCFEIEHGGKTAIHSHDSFFEALGAQARKSVV